MWLCVLFKVLFDDLPSFFALGFSGKGGIYEIRWPGFASIFGYGILSCNFYNKYTFSPFHTCCRSALMVIVKAYHYIMYGRQLRRGIIAKLHRKKYCRTIISSLTASLANMELSRWFSCNMIPCTHVKFGFTYIL